jgi:hypothetical protein
MSTTLTDAKQTLYEELTANASTGQPIAPLSRIVRIYNGEPPAGEMVGPVAATLTTQSLNPTEFVFAFRIYVQMGMGVGTAQRLLDEIVYDAEIGLNNRYTRNTWNWSYAEAFDCLVAETDLQYPRDDF